MATDTRTLPAYLADDTDYRAWGSGISAQLAAVGLVQTANTGQINWATATRPGSLGTSAGYEIWRFNDALQATLPIYIKVDYSVGSALNVPRLIITVGTNTNGAGTITGQAGTTFTSTVTGKTAGVTLPSYCSHTAGQFALVTNLDSNSINHHILVLVERSHDSSGTPTADAIITAFATGNSTAIKQVIPPSGTVPGNTSAVVIWPSPSAGQSTSAGGNVSLGIGTAHGNGKLSFARTLVYRHTDIGELTPITISFMGSTRTYMPMGDGGTQLGGQSADATAIPWE